MSVEVFTSKKKASQASPSSNGTVRSILGSTFRYVEDVMRALKDISEELDALQNMARRHRLLVRSSNSAEASGDFTLDVHQNGPTDTAPTLKSLGLKKEDLTSMKKNYTVIREAYRKFNDLVQIENEFETKFAGSAEAPKVVALIRQLRFKAQQTVDDAMKFLQDVARRAIPPRMEKFCREFELVIRNGLKYNSKISNRYTYVYENEGSIIFSEYFHLRELVDDNGRLFPNKFIVTSYVVGGPATGNPFLINVLDQYQPPGEFPLGRGALNIKQAQRILALMLQQDRFATSMGNIPLRDILDPSAFKTSMFMYQHAIQTISSNDHELIFTLKKSVSDPEEIKKISMQLYLEMSGHTSRRVPHYNTDGTPSGQMKQRTKLAMSVSHTRPVSISFMFERTSGQPAVTPDELDFLKDRFSLDDADIAAIVQRINLAG